MRIHSRVWIIVGLLFRKANAALLALLFPSWYGTSQKYQPEKYYMRGPGPKWRAKHQSKSAPSPSC